MLLAELFQSTIDLPFPQQLLAVGVGTAILMVLVAMFVMATSRGIRRSQQRGTLSGLIYLGNLGLIGVLAVTAFGSILRFGHMSGYALLAHIAAAGAFVFLLIFVACLFLPSGAEYTSEGYRRGENWWVTRWSAWALMLSSLAAAGTMLLSMLPILDTEGLLGVASIHRYAGLAVVVAALIHLLAISCSKLGWR